jgi:predicted solute-binding protein
MELQGLLKEKKGRTEGSTTTTASYFRLLYIKKAQEVNVILDHVLAAVVTLLLVHVAC